MKAGFYDAASAAHAQTYIIHISCKPVICFNVDGKQLVHKMHPDIFFKTLENLRENPLLSA